jgi:CDP-4-dehydro-6-deoxyglucose reductase, E3
MNGWKASAANPHEALRVDVANLGRGFEVALGQSLLDAALGASWKLPHSCKGGACGLCKARLLRGEITYPNGRPLGLSDAEVAARYILLCQARAGSDLELELQDVRPAGQTDTMRLPCRIERAMPAAHDVMRLLLRLPPAVDFEFKPGQYVDILLRGARRRSFSIASSPRDSRLLELHVRRVEGGEFSEWLFGGKASHVADALITIEGPMGLFFYREVPAGAGPLLLVGGGTGLAPLLSILRHVIESKSARELTLYWGVRGTRDLYVDREVRELLNAAPRVRYVPVLSQSEPLWRGRIGDVHAAVLEDLEDLSAYDIYTAGPPAMIEAVRREFPARRASLDRLYCDSFDYASDSADRQRTSADTKS